MQKCSQYNFLQITPFLLFASVCESITILFRLRFYFLLVCSYYQRQTFNTKYYLPNCTQLFFLFWGLEFLQHFLINCFSFQLFCVKTQTYEYRDFIIVIVCVNTFSKAEDVYLLLRRILEKTQNWKTYLGLNTLNRIKRKVHLTNNSFQIQANLN